MKTFKLIILLTVVLGFFSCKKENIQPESKSTVIYNTPNTSPIGYTWELYSGRVFVTNLDNGNKIYYQHFGGTKNTSNLDIFTPSGLPMDILTKGLTTWKFTSTNSFILDDVTNYTYEMGTNGVIRVYGLENGSARIIEVLNSTETYMNVKVFESNGNDGTNNYSFYSILTFVKVGSNTVTEFDVPYGYVNGGVLNTTTTVSNNLTGTKWVVTKYIQNFVTTYVNDTLDFISQTQYKINNSTTRNYSLSNIVGSNMKSLSLYSFTTLGGDWSGQVQSTFINDWVINNSLFTNMFNSNSPETRVWVTRIQ